MLDTERAPADTAPPRVAPLRPAAWEPPAKYQVLRVIGTGGMGTVLLARDRNLGRLVAVKHLRTECPVFLARLRHEARILARLDHPSIVRVHELDVHACRTYLAMDYVRGGNLALARLEPVPLMRTLRGVIDALGHAHARGIVHRDVKPQNLLLADARLGPEGGTAVLTDFGVALDPRVGDGGRGPSPVAGTPLTMSPEQARGEPVGPASDVFSLGATLYRQLTGVWPFRGRTINDVLVAIATREPEPLPASGRPVPRRLASIVMRALAKEPEARFESMEELGAAVDRFLAGRSFFSLSLDRLRRRTPRPSTLRIHPEDPS